MKKSDALKQKRHAANELQLALINRAKAANVDFTEAEKVEFDTRTIEMASLDVEIARAMEMEAVELRAASANRGAGVVPEGIEDVEVPVFSIHRAIRSQLKNGDPLQGAELAAHESVMRSDKPKNVVFGGVAIPLGRAAAQSVTGDSGTKGGRLVATDLGAPIDNLAPAPLMAAMGAVYLTGLTGNLRFPKNEGGIVATWEGETATTAETANTYGYVDSIPKRLSVTVPISLQNLMQSSIDLEAYTIQKINQAIENAIDAAAVNGTGTGQPLGILNNTGVNSVTTAANGSAPTWNMIVDAETAVFVENASSAKMNYLVNPKLRGTFKKTKHEAGDLGYIMDTEGAVNGYGASTSNHVPSNLVKGTGTGLSAMIFGDFSQLMINQWGFMDLSVDEVSRKKEGLVEVTVNVFVDVLVKQPKAFTVVKGLITT